MVGWGSFEQGTGCWEWISTAKAVALGAGKSGQRAGPRVGGQDLALAQPATEQGCSDLGCTGHISGTDPSRRIGVLLNYHRVRGKVSPRPMV